MPQLAERSLRSLCKSYSLKEQEVISHAIEIAKKAHQGQVRKSSGVDYIIHPLHVAIDLEEKYHDFVLTVSALLHDSVEDCDHLTMKEVYDTFGDDIGFVVDAVTKTVLHFYNRSETFENRVDKFLFGGMKDIRVFLLKLADRKDNLKTLDQFHVAKQMRISFETQAIYLPLKMILGFDSAQLSLEHSQRKFDTILKNREITNYESLLDVLYDYSFYDFNRDVFEELYTCSENVVWEVQDMTCFERLCETSEFEACAEVVSMYFDGEHFRARFKFKQMVLPQTERLTRFSATYFTT